LVQLQVLNTIIENKDASILLLNNLNEEFFSDYPNEFGFIKRHLMEYGKIPDKVSFLDKFPNFELIEVTEPTSYLLTELYKDRNTRFLAKTFNTIRKLIGEGKTEEAMKLYSSASEDIATAIPMETVDLLENTDRFDDYLEKCSDFSKYYVRTGFSELDDLIGGWDRNEELATIAARPGIGKSWILLVVAKAALEQGLRVGIYSGEMSERKVGYRFDTLVSHISNSALTKGHEHVRNEYRNYIDSLKGKYRGCLKVLTPAMIQGPAGVNALRAFIEKEKLDILCVDQHSLLEDDRNARNPVERAANISKDLKNLQVMKKIPIIAVSQQNRASTDTGVGTANIAQSDRISQDSTVILFLEQKDNILTMTLAKARDAVNNKKLHYAVDFNKGVFQYMPSEEDNPSSCEELREEYDGSMASGEDVF
jgi:replicative DNA helicase